MTKKQKYEKEINDLKIENKKLQQEINLFKRAYNPTLTKMQNTINELSEVIQNLFNNDFINPK